jgi:hypothetical protein
LFLPARLAETAFTARTVMRTPCGQGRASRHRLHCRPGLFFRASPGVSWPRRCFVSTRPSAYVRANACNWPRAQWCQGAVLPPTVPPSSSLVPLTSLCTSRSTRDEDDARQELDTLIFQELTLGKFTPAAQLWLESRIAHLVDARGCHAVVLACTELGALRSCGSTGRSEGGEGGEGGGEGWRPGEEGAGAGAGEGGMVFDTTRLHADAAVAFMCTT